MNGARTTEYNYEVMNCIQDAVIVLDTEGRIVFLNRAADRLKNLHTPPLAVGNIALDSIHFQWRQVVGNIIQSLIESKLPSTFESNYFIDGRKVHYDISASPITNSDGLVCELIFQIRDISLQKIYENKLGSISDDLSRLINSANAMIIGIDTQNYVTGWNDFASDITGYSKEEVLAKSFSDLLLDSKSRMMFSGIAAEAMSGEFVMNYELLLRSKEGKRLNFLVNVASRKNQNNEIVGVTVIGQDITELSAYRASLEQIVRERTEALQIALEKEKQLVAVKNKFVSIASHEFRSPISVITNHAGVIKKMLRTDAPEEIMLRLENIMTQATHMTALLEDMLVIGKTEAGKINAHNSQVDVHSFFAALIDDILETTAHSHKVVTTFPQESVVIQSDVNLLRNIFINLLGNAVKFSPGQKEVYFDINVTDSVIEIKITDKGIGISNEDLEKVFQPFTRGDNAKNIKGTGLGLSIVKKAVEILKGELLIQSKLNHGTTFTVILNRTK
jgi:PAS domain S-box-containing protein